MPELFLPRSQFVNEYRQQGRLHAFEITRVRAARYGEVYVGRGKESIVLLDANEQKVNAYRLYDKHDTYDERVRFYAHKVFERLFPHNFPHMHAAVANREERVGGTVRQFVKKSKTRTLLSSITNNSLGISYPFAQVQDACESVGIQFHNGKACLIDDVPHNFIIGKDGGQYYIDEVQVWVDPAHVVSLSGRLLTLSERIASTVSDRVAVNNYLLRMQKLAVEKYESKIPIANEVKTA